MQAMSLNKFNLNANYSGAARISVGGGNILGGRPSRGSGGLRPRTPENFRKFAKKNFLRKLQETHTFSYFSKKVNEPCINFFAHLDGKHNCLGNI